MVGQERVAWACSRCVTWNRFAGTQHIALGKNMLASLQVEHGPKQIR